MNEIFSNIAKITGLIKRKDGELVKINAKMAVRAHSHSNMSAEQMETFKRFSDYYAANGELIKSTLEDINARVLAGRDANSLNGDEVSVIRKRQNAAIFVLNDVIEHCEETLHAIG